MSLLVLGINHQTAPLSVREKISFNQEHSRLLLKKLLHSSAEEVVILSTCNRTEIYLNAASPETAINTLLANSSIQQHELEKSLYIHTDIHAVEHIMQVACGLDSLVLGEQQILAQMKAAVNLAAECQSINRHFHILFQRVFSLAKYVRSTTQLGACPVSIASVAVRLAKDIFPEIEKAHVLLLGAGDTIKLVSKYLHTNNISQITIASRHLENAQGLAQTINAQAISLNDLPNALAKADIVMSATASQVPIIGKGRVESALKIRKNKPMFFIDMAVPRDIEPEVSELEAIHLYTIDDLKNATTQNQKSRQHAAQQATHIIKEHAAEYMQWLQGLESTDVIKAFRSHIEEIRETEQAKAYKLLEQGRDPKLVIDYLANSFANKLMHGPSVQMRQACEYGRKELLKTVQELFAISVATESTET